MTQIRYTPSPEHRFWLYSPEGDGLTFWRTAKERDVYAARDIHAYLDDNVWFEEVQGIVAGVVTHVVQPVNVQRPVGTLDEDGYDEDGNYWEQPDGTRCDYALMPLPQGGGGGVKFNRIMLSLFVFLAGSCFGMNVLLLGVPATRDKPVRIAWATTALLTAVLAPAAWRDQ